MDATRAPPFALAPTYSVRSNYQWVFNAMGINATVARECIAYYAAQPGAPIANCFMAQYALPFIRTPLFIANSLADSWQASNIMVRNRAVGMVGRTRDLERHSHTSMCPYANRSIPAGAAV